MKQKRKMGRKLIGFLLTLAMVVGLMPIMSMTTYAATALPSNGGDAGSGDVYFVGYTVDSQSGEYQNDGSPMFDVGDAKACIGFNGSYSVEFSYSREIVPHSYYFRTGDDTRWYDARNPSAWTLEGKKADGTWIVLDDKSGQSYTTENNTEVKFSISNNNAYKTFRLTITAINPDGEDAYPVGNMPTFQLSEFYMSGVEPIPVTEITLNKTTTTLKAGDNETLTVTFNPDGATNKTVIWTSSDESVATVADGVVTAVAKGTAIVTATATNGTDDANDDKSATCTVNVEEVQEEEQEEEITPDTPATDTSINTEVKTAEGAPAIKADNLDNALAEKLLTEAEKAEYANGTPVLVYLDVKRVDKANVPADDVAAIDKVTGESGYTYGDCLDISLWKKLGNGEASQVHDTNGNLIKMTVTVPDSLKAPAGFTRTFRVVRVHEGVAKVLAEDTRTSLEFSSDGFSSYFLVYRDTKIEEATNTSVDTSSNTQSTPAPAQATVAEVPKTGQYMPIAALIMLILSMTGMVMVITGLKKKNHI